MPQVVILKAFAHRFLLQALPFCAFDTLLHALHALLKAAALMAMQAKIRGPGGCLFHLPCCPVVRFPTVEFKALPRGIALYEELP